MKEFWKRLARLVERYRFWIMLSVMIVLLGAGAILIARATVINRLDSNPARGAAIETNKLLGLTKQLGSNFNDQDNGRATRDYLADLAAMRRACQRINRYHEVKPGGNLSADDTVRISQSYQLCQDLTRVVTYSQTIYQSTEPLLTAATKPRRYQTIWPFESIIRHRQLAEASDALTILGRSKSDITDFPSTAIPRLKQLQSDIRGSKGVAYFPELQAFQFRLLSERQQYWLDYVGLNGLSHYLKTQLDAYCQSSSTRLQICERQS